MTDELDDKSLMDDVFSKSSDMGSKSADPGDKAEVPAKEAPVEPKPEQISKAEEVKDDDAPLQGRDPTTGRFVPVTELVAERKKLKGEREAESKLRQEAEARAKVYQDQIAIMQRQFQQFQAQQQPQQQARQEIPDAILDPEGFARHQQDIVDARMLDMHVNMSESIARMKYSDAVVDDALHAARVAGIARRFITARNPFEALIHWRRQQKIAEEIGGDFDGFKKRIGDEARQEALANLKATGSPQAPAQTQRFPTTLADQTATGDQSGAVLTDTQLMDDVFAKKRRV